MWRVSPCSLFETGILFIMVCGYLNLCIWGNSFLPSHVQVLGLQKLSIGFRDWGIDPYICPARALLSNPLLNSPLLERKRVSLISLTSDVILCSSVRNHANNWKDIDEFIDIWYMAFLHQRVKKQWTSLRKNVLELDLIRVTREWRKDRHTYTETGIRSNELFIACWSFSNYQSNVEP